MCTGTRRTPRIDALLPPRRAATRPHRALPYREIPGALVALNRCTASPSAGLCLQFLILTAATSGEAREARWHEIDMKRRMWVVPAQRMKSGVEHRRPLSEPALAVLDEAKALDDGSGLIFPSPRGHGRFLHRGTLMNVLRDAGLAEITTVAGFRSAFRDWAMDCTDVDYLVMDLALGLVAGNRSLCTFNGHGLLGGRLELIEHWGRFVCGSDAPDASQRFGKDP